MNEMMRISLLCAILAETRVFAWSPWRQQRRYPNYPNSYSPRSYPPFWGERPYSYSPYHQPYKAPYDRYDRYDRRYGYDGYYDGGYYDRYDTYSRYNPYGRYDAYGRYGRNENISTEDDGRMTSRLGLLDPDWRYRTHDSYFSDW